MMHYLFSFGKKEKAFPVAGGRSIVLRWKYVGIFECPVAFFRERVLVEKEGTEKTISYHEAKRLYGGKAVLVPFFDAYGLYGFFVAIFSLYYGVFNPFCGGEMMSPCSPYLIVSTLLNNLKAELLETWYNMKVLVIIALAGLPLLVWYIKKL